MSDCCSIPKDPVVFPRRHVCPVNGKAYPRVSVKTIKHHIRAPWTWHSIHQGYYFCSDPDCDVVYFGQDDSVIRKADVRTPVGIKDKSGEATVCYCYGISRSEAANNPLAREFVLSEVKQGHCACESRNPSGRCCLADFPKK